MSYVPRFTGVMAVPVFQPGGLIEGITVEAMEKLRFEFK